MITIIRTLHKALQWLLEWITIFLMVLLTVVVIVGVIYRLAGDSLSWYDEIAAIILAWITYYGSALAALKRGHIGFDSALLAIPMPARMVAVAIGEILLISFFALMAWAGIEVLLILEGDSLISLRWVPVQFTQSVIPIGAILFIIAELLSLPAYWRQVAMGQSSDHSELHDTGDA